MEIIAQSSLCYNELGLFFDEKPNYSNVGVFPSNVLLMEENMTRQYSLVVYIEIFCLFCYHHTAEDTSQCTFATNCYYKAVDIKILSWLLGHADVNITYNIYIHLCGDGFDEVYAALCK